MQSMPFGQLIPFMAVLTLLRELAMTIFFIAASVAAVAAARWLNRHS